MDDLKKQLIDCKKQIEELTDNWKRALADYQNLEKRVNSEREHSGKYAAENIISELLQILDILQKAEEHLKDKGLELAVNDFWDVLKRYGVRKIDVAGKKFDPHLMECTEVVKDENDGAVIEEVRGGYFLWDRVIRVAQVKVGKKKIEDKAEELAKAELTKGSYM